MEPLLPLPQFAGRSGPVVLCIMDGVAYSKYDDGDAVKNAYTPTLKWLHEHCPGTRLKAHGKAVGMPSEDDMGNSEVGHNAIGCGRVYAQGARLVNEAIASGSIWEGAWKEVLAQVRQTGGTLHFIGLFSDGNVHAHINHLRAMLERARAEGQRRVRLHLLLDGRDVGETSALDYVDPFEAWLGEFRAAGWDYRVASGGGRMNITMDRYGADWDMVRRGWETHVLGQGRQFASAREAIVTLRAETKAIDQDLPAFVIAEQGLPLGPIVDGDSVVMTNFRGDRALELTAAFEQETFSKFDRQRWPRVCYAGMMQYDGDTLAPKRFLVQPPSISRTMGEYLARAGVRQLAVSETQKFGHVTYFFNGNRSGKFSEALEDYVEVPSDRLPFEQRPWMKAAEITDVVLKALAEGRHRFIRVNFPNGDMVGHTGDFLAATISVSVVDLCLARLLPAVAKANGILIVTADHGNADEMVERDKKTGGLAYENGRPKSKTCHTLNPVPCLIYDPGFKGEYRLHGQAGLGISSLAATSLNLLGFQTPEGYDSSLIAFD